MPTLRGRYDHTKVWRPAGMLFAAGEADLAESPCCTTHRAVARALGEFEREFERRPAAERLVVEVVFNSATVVATAFELPEEDR